MTNSAGKRVLGLSPRARRVVIPVMLVALVVIVVGTLLTRRADGAGGTDATRHDPTGPVVGRDLHAVKQFGDRLFVGGHGGAGYQLPTGGWSQIPTLHDKDVMGWAASGTTLIAAGHAGLYASTDAGRSFSPVGDLANADAHAIGASGSVIYLATTELGLLVSTDGGHVFDLRSEEGRAFMGTIWIDPTNPRIAIARSTRKGPVRTTNGGRTWTPLGNSTPVTDIAVSDTGRQLVAISSGGAQQSNDGGKTWTALSVPAGANAASYTSDGDLIVAGLSGDRAAVYRQTAAGWIPLD